jgi:hypothetical protein
MLPRQREPPRKRARAYIPLIDRFTCSQKDKNKLKNILACVDNIQECLHLTNEANILGERSSLTRAIEDNNR